MNESSLKSWLAVLGGATGYSDEQLLMACRVGRAIAQHKHHIITGGTSGIPYAAALAARAAGAMVVGLSPALDAAEHQSMLDKPLGGVDLMVYTGLRFDGRSPLIVRSVIGMIFIGGGAGTLNEFTSAWMAGDKVLGVLDGSGGITDLLPSIIPTLQADWGNTVIFHRNPDELVARVVETCATLQRKYPSGEPLQTHRHVETVVQRFLEQEGK